MTIKEKHAFCAACNQPIRTRLGVELTKTQLRVFDTLRTDERIGVAGLAERLRLKENNVYQVIKNINDRLAATEWQICNLPGYGYRLEQTEKHALGRAA